MSQKGDFVIQSYSEKQKTTVYLLPTRQQLCFKPDLSSAGHWDKQAKAQNVLKMVMQSKKISPDVKANSKIMPYRECFEPKRVPNKDMKEMDIASETTEELLKKYSFDAVLQAADLLADIGKKSAIFNASISSIDSRIQDILHELEGYEGQISPEDAVAVCNRLRELRHLRRESKNIRELSGELTNDKIDLVRVRTRASRLLNSEYSRRTDEPLLLKPHSEHEDKEPVPAPEQEKQRCIFQICPFLDRRGVILDRGGELAEHLTPFFRQMGYTIRHFNFSLSKKSSNGTEPDDAFADNTAVAN